MAKAVRRIPGAVTKVDLATGEETHEAAAWTVLPPPAGACPICAVKHGPAVPHNAQSLYYQMTFAGMIGRPPTWADAIAHCDEETKRRWEVELRRRGAWTAHPDGEPPIVDHGV
jgi:hypothetical protein